MIKKSIIIFFINLLICNQTFLYDVFNYSFNNIEHQKSIYSFKIIKSDSNNLNYNITWSPTNNLIMNTNFINNSWKDNKIYYAINFGFILSDNLYSSILGSGIHLLKFDQNFNNTKWVSYFSNTKVNLYNWFNINLGLSYYYNNEFSFFDLSLYLSRKIYKNLDLGIGTNLAISSFIHKIYFGINYSL